jgi:signal transduction histidine kinase
MLGLIPLLILGASLGGYWLSRRALAPVDRIIADSRSIGHHNLSRRLMIPKSGDELQRLSETLNEMIARLETAFQQIARFTADASHELRSPVAFIRARAEIALLKPRCAETYRAAVEDMYGEATRMTELIENLLTLARADSGASQLAMVPIDLREPIRLAATHGQSLAEGKGVSFSSKVPDSPVPVLGDATALRRLSLILIENAVKYTPARGRVDVGLAATGTSVVLTVRDTGIGIAEEDLERIFERFYRSDKARQRDSGGTGLGLSIARWIAEVHRAQLEVQSELGFGSTFLVRLERAV